MRNASIMPRCSLNLVLARIDQTFISWLRAWTLRRASLPVPLAGSTEGTTMAVWRRTGGAQQKKNSCDVLIREWPRQH